jgi:hypothetical protein
MAANVARKVVHRTFLARRAELLNAELNVLRSGIAGAQSVVSAFLCAVAAASVDKTPVTTHWGFAFTNHKQSRKPESSAHKFRPSAKPFIQIGEQEPTPGSN